MNWTFERRAGPYEFTEGPVRDGEGVVFTDVPNGRITWVTGAKSRIEGGKDVDTGVLVLEGGRSDSRQAFRSCISVSSASSSSPMRSAIRSPVSAVASSGAPIAPLWEYSSKPR